MTDDLVTRAKGRLAYLVERGEIKTPELIVRFIARIEADAATIARLTGERETLWPQEAVEEAARNAQPILAELADKQEAENAALEATAARLRAELNEARKWMRHDELCGFIWGYGYCTCGLDAILAKIDGGQ